VAGNFAIWSYTTKTRDLTVNAIAPYSGTKTLPKGMVVMEITADGAWSITPN